ncbi:GH24465 [Drosophila grimshawi]|uniref:GH24465 n=1 Tax=Drosophila grimshawi TaxID=7222 RepID=B4JLR4_DROGR|nr:GH24465 [Drosophila grimshawi]
MKTQLQDETSQTTDGTELPKRTNEVFRIPSKLLCHPISVFAVFLADAYAGNLRNPFAISHFR